MFGLNTKLYSALETLAKSDPQINLKPFNSIMTARSVGTYRPLFDKITILNEQRSRVPLSALCNVLPLNDQVNKEDFQLFIRDLQNKSNQKFLTGFLTWPNLLILTELYNTNTESIKGQRLTHEALAKEFFSIIEGKNKERSFFNVFKSAYKLLLPEKNHEALLYELLSDKDWIILQWSCGKGYKNITQFLIEEIQSYWPNDKDKLYEMLSANNWSAFKRACQNGHDNTAQFLIAQIKTHWPNDKEKLYNMLRAKGENLYFLNGYESDDDSEVDWWTLKIAVNNGHSQIVELIFQQAKILQKEGEILADIEEDNWDIFFEACNNNRAKVVEFFIRTIHSYESNLKIPYKYLATHREFALNCALKKLSAPIADFVLTTVEKHSPDELEYFWSTIAKKDWKVFNLACEEKKEDFICVLLQKSPPQYHLYEKFSAYIFTYSSNRGNEITRLNSKLLERKQQKQETPESIALWLWFRNYPALLSTPLIEQLCTLNAKEANLVLEAFRVLQQAGSDFLNEENLLLLVGYKDQALLQAKLMTGQMNVVELQQLVEQHCGEKPPQHTVNEQFLALFKKSRCLFAKMDYTLILQGLLQLRAEEQQWLYQQLNAAEQAVALTDSLIEKEHSVTAHLLLELILLEQIYRSVPQYSRQDLPNPNDTENSMLDSLLRSARQRLNALNTGQAALSDEQLESTEENIRAFLLQHIIDELQQSIDLSQQEEERILLRKKVDFLRANLLELAAGKNKTLIATAVEALDSTSSIAQTAWRAYEPTAEVYGWPNLLTEQANSQKNNTAFSTRASTEDSHLEGKTITREAVSKEARNIAAKCFLALQAKELSDEEKYTLAVKFISALAEIRRAHNTPTDSAKKENPSCYPGILSRLGIFLEALPQFRSLSASHDVAEITVQELKAIMQILISELLLQQDTDFEKRLLLSAINLYGLRSRESLLTDRNSIELNLTYTDADLRYLLGLTATEHLSDAQRQQGLQLFIEQVQILRAEIMQQLHGADGSRLYNQLSERLSKKEIFCDPNTLNYLIAKGLADLAQLISLPQQLLQASQTVSEEELCTTQEKMQTSTASLRKQDMQRFGFSPKSQLMRQNLTLKLHAYVDNTEEAKQQVAQLVQIICARTLSLQSDAEIHAQISNNITELYSPDHDDDRIDRHWLTTIASNPTTLKEKLALPNTACDPTLPESKQADQKRKKTNRSYK